MENIENALKVCDKPDRIDQRTTDVPQWVACRKCKKCLNIRHTELSGRALAESLVSDHTVALTLTYADWTGSRAQYLQYRDVQLMLKRLRNDGYNVRFLVAGEYGTKRQRAHWHCVLYFKGECPPLPPVETKKQHWKYWADVPHRNALDQEPKPIGFVYVQQPDFHGLRYVVKYATKDEGTGKSTRKVQSSLKPPLGAEYWDRLAADQVKNRTPFTFSYELPDACYGNGNSVSFYTTDASARLKWAAYRRAMLEHHPTKPLLIHEKAQGAWWRVIVPAAVRSYLASPRREYRLPAGKGRYLRAKRYQKHYALLKLESGDMIGVKFNGPDKELSAWRVAHVQEMIALARGRRSTKTRQLKYGELPF